MSGVALSLALAAAAVSALPVSAPAAPACGVLRNVAVTAAFDARSVMDCLATFARFIATEGQTPDRMVAIASTAHAPKAASCAI